MIINKENKNEKKFVKQDFKKSLLREYNKFIIKHFILVTQ